MAYRLAEIDERSAPASSWARPSFIGHEQPQAGGACAPYRQRLDALTAQRRRVARGEPLFRHGDPVTALYEVRAGWFKTCMSDSSGRCQVTGFPISGELLGLDGIGNELHSVSAVALEDALVCVMPCAALEGILHDFPRLQRDFHKLMSREIVRQHAMLLMLGRMAADERIASFVLDLSRRLHAQGFSPSAWLLRMTREEIGSYLGLQLETVSRSFSRLQAKGILAIRHREIHVLDEPALRRIVQGSR